MATGTSNDNSIPNLKCGNPYQTLNLPNFATQSQIKKSFRLLSLQLHPDKRKPNLSPKEHDELDHQFILVQEAKSFLLDVEYEKQKEKYDLMLKSKGKRMEEEQKREEQMDKRRKGMRDDLYEKIKREMEKQMKQKGGYNKSFSNNDKHDYNDIDGLKKAGKRMREEYNQKSQSKKQKSEKELLKQKQIRLKWSRNKMGLQTTQMISQMLSSSFGQVESVELIGKKGNAALVTFVNENSCKLCVDAYLNSDKLRATYVGRRDNENDDDYDDYAMDGSTLNRERDRESVEERKLRQEAEREKILRQMEMDEQSGNTNTDTTNATSRNHDGDQTQHPSERKESKAKSLFPPLFPATSREKLNDSYLKRLEEMERTILKDIVPPDVLKSAQILKHVQ